MKNIDYISFAYEKSMGKVFQAFDWVRLFKTRVILSHILRNPNEALEAEVSGSYS